MTLDAVYLQVLQADGGNYCASINAASLALIDAGIPMKDIVCASSASFMKETPVVDINHMEESQAGVEVRLISCVPIRSDLPDILKIAVCESYFTNSRLIGSPPYIQCSK